MAAAYAFHIGEAQAFFDGNKRTGLDAALTSIRGCSMHGARGSTRSSHESEMRDWLLAVRRAKFDA